MPSFWYLKFGNGSEHFETLVDSGPSPGPTECNSHPHTQIQHNIILPSTHMPTKWSPSFTFSNQNFIWISHFSLVCCDVLPILFLTWSLKIHLVKSTNY